MSLGAYYVGFFNDDAFYIIGARSLLAGRYAELNHPAEPPLVNYLPGYPLLLAPLAAVSGGAFLPLQLLSAALTLAGVALLRALFAGELPDGALWAAAAAAALNPLTVSVSGAVLSDPAYTAYSLAVLLAARRGWSAQAPAAWAAMGLLAGGAFYLRPTGLALVAALPAALLLGGRARAAASCFACGAAAAALFPLRNYLLRGYGLVYAAELADPFARAPLGAAAEAFGRSLGFYPFALFARELWRWPFAAGAAPAEALAGAAGSLLLLWGASRFVRRGGWRAAAALYALFYAAAIALWAKLSPRYLLPLMPFACVWVFAALARADELLDRRGRLVGAALAAFLLCAAPPLTRIVTASLFRRSPLAAGPRRTHAWIRRETPQTAVFGAELDGRLYLLAQRKTLRVPRAGGPEGLAVWALNSGVAFVLVEPTGAILATARGSGPHDPVPAERLTAWLDASPRFALAFADAEEGTRVYRRIGGGGPAVGN